MLDLLKTFRAKGGAPGYPSTHSTRRKRGGGRGGQARYWRTSVGERTVYELHLESGRRVTESAIRYRLHTGTRNHARLTAPPQGGGR